MRKKILALVFLIKNVVSSECATECSSNSEKVDTFFSICAYPMSETSLSTRTSFNEEDEKDNNHKPPIFDLISLDVIRNSMPLRFNELMPQIQYAYDDILHKISRRTKENIIHYKSILTKIVLLKTIKHECTRLMSYPINEADETDNILMKIEYKKNILKEEEIKFLESKLIKNIHIHSILYNFIEKKAFIFFDELKMQSAPKFFTNALKFASTWTIEHVFNPVLGAPLIEHIAKISKNEKISNILMEWLIILSNDITREAHNHYKQSVFWKNETLFQNHIFFQNLYEALKECRKNKIKEHYDNLLKTYKEDMKPKIIGIDPQKKIGLLAAAIQWHHTLSHRRKIITSLMLVSDPERLERIQERYINQKRTQQRSSTLPTIRSNSSATRELPL